MTLVSSAVGGWGCCVAADKFRGSCELTEVVEVLLVVEGGSKGSQACDEDSSWGGSEGIMMGRPRSPHGDNASHLLILAPRKWKFVPRDVEH